MFPPPPPPQSSDPRINLHLKFSTNKKGMSPWFLEQMDLPTDAHVLELGCGSCNFWLTTHRFIPNGWKITLTDAPAARYADAERILSHDKGITFKEVDPAQPLPFENASQDAVVMLHVLNRLQNIPATLREVHRVLKPGGKLYAAAYGEKHMDELYFLFLRFNPQVAAVSGRLTKDMKFSLENGTRQLRQFFWDVQMRHYDDALEVTEPQPLFEYLMAMAGIAPSADNQEGLYALAAFISQEIKEKGSIHITKQEGIFIATK